jgi:acyl-coenzyme A synthetase/AMP-(fatty) acid ligase
MTHPAVADAGVVGVAGRDDGDIVIAFVVLAPGSPASDEELLGFGRERLPARAVPTSIRFVEALPRNTVGKLIRGELRSIASDTTD